MELFAYRSHNVDLVHRLDEKPRQKDYVLHTHTTFQVCYLKSGSCIYHVEGSEYPMRPGDLILTFPQEVHYIEIDPNTPCERVSLNFGTSFFHAIDPDRHLHIPFIDREAGQSNLYAAADFPDLNMGVHFANMLSSQNDRCQIMIHLLMLLRDLRTAFECTEYRDNSVDTLENRVIRYIGNHLRKDLSLDTLSEKFFISKPQLYRRFKKATGTSVAKYVHTKRMLCARQMLLDNEKPTAICADCGFKDYSTFYRAYVRYFGHSPKEERHQTAETE